MSGIKMTKKLLDDYRKLKREIPILELELQAMREGDNGLGNSTWLGSMDQCGTDKSR